MSASESCLNCGTSRDYQTRCCDDLSRYKFAHESVTSRLLQRDRQLLRATQEREVMRELGAHYLALYRNNVEKKEGIPAPTPIEFYEAKADISREMMAKIDAEDPDNGQTEPIYGD